MSNSEHANQRQFRVATLIIVIAVFLLVWVGSNFVAVASSTDADAAFSIISKNRLIPGECSPDARNLLNNPGFEDGTAGWSSYFANGAASFTKSTPAFECDHAARIAFNGRSDNMQLYQTGFTLQPNTEYVLSFAGRSNTGHDLSVFLHKHTSLYNNYGINNVSVDLTSSWQSFTIPFTTSSDVSDMRLRFWFVGDAAAGDEYWLDNMRIVQAPSCSPDPSNLLNNPGFEGGTAGWSSYFANGEASFSTSSPAFECEQAARITFNGRSDNMQLYQTGFSLQPNTDYVLSFAGRSNTGHDLSVFLHKHTSLYNNYGINNVSVDLTSSWRSYTIPFTTSSDISNLRLRFWFVGDAAAGDEYWLDNVRIVPAGDNPSPATSTPVLTSTIAVTDTPPPGATQTPTAPTATPGPPGDGETELLVFDWNRPIEWTHYGFPYSQPPIANGDWTFPVNFAEGTLYFRAEIHDQPIAQDMQLQFCFWQEKDGYYTGLEACGPLEEVRGTSGNVVTWSAAVQSMWNKDGPIEWDRARFRGGVAIKNKNGDPVSDYNGWNWSGEDPDEWYPLDMRFTVVVVAKDASFSGWDTYRDYVDPVPDVGIWDDSRNQSLWTHGKTPEQLAAGIQQNKATDRGRVWVDPGRTTVVTDNGRLLRGETLRASFLTEREFTVTHMERAMNLNVWKEYVEDYHLNAVRFLLYREPADYLGTDKWECPTARCFSTVESALPYIDAAVEIASEMGMYLIIDYHPVGGYDPADVTDWWRVLAPRYKDRTHVLYELTNEPVIWNPNDYTAEDIRWQEQMYQYLRNLAPDTHIILWSFGSIAECCMLPTISQAPGIDYTNATVAYHPYAMTINSWDDADIRQLRNTGYPVFATELGSLDEDIRKYQTVTSRQENLDASWLWLDGTGQGRAWQETGSVPITWDRDPDTRIPPDPEVTPTPVPPSPTATPGSGGSDTELLVYDWDEPVTTAHHGFPYDQPPMANGDWASPINFAEGTLYYRAQIHSQPEPQNMRLQFCFWQEKNGDNFGLENCGDLKNVYGGSGTVVTWSTRVADMWKLDGNPIEWDRARYRNGVAIKNSDGDPVSDYLGWNWNGEDPNKWYPLDMRYTVVVVAKGAAFSGWDNYR